MLQYKISKFENFIRRISENYFSLYKGRKMRKHNQYCIIQTYLRKNKKDN